ncbi:MAG: OmpA family protein [Bacteroidales bacterium]|jgi:outer membrane protein OmpA-like peptidoglycan-associated protein|nr:OmpA family protein [Bacteroidales bacterium]
MNKLQIIAILLFLTGGLFAQEYNNGWHLRIGGGAQMLFSSDAQNLAFKNRLTPLLSLSGGKWISPVWGLRIQAEGYSLNGYSTTEGLYLADPLNNGLVYGNNDPVREYVTIRPDGSYRHYIRYANIHADLQLSVFNLFDSQKFHRWDIIPAVGFGYFHTFEYKGIPALNSISTNFSLMGKYSITKALDINLEVATTVLPDAFEGRISGKNYENTLGATIGLTYRFKSKKSVCQKQTARVEIRRDTITVIEYVHDTVEVEKIVERAVEKNAGFRLASIRFNLASEKPAAGQDIQYENIVNYLTTHPNAKIILEGYGDKGHGSDRENIRIAGVRAKNVQKLLIEKYTIDASRIEIKAIGSQEQPYEKGAWNRVVIVKTGE